MPYDDLPLQLVLTIVPPNGTTSPTPSGGIVISLDGLELLSVPLPPDLSFVTTLTPELSGALSLLGRRLLISAMNENDETFLAYSLRLLSVPGCLLSLAQLFARATAPIRRSDGASGSPVWACSRSGSRSRSGSCSDRRDTARERPGPRVGQAGLS